MTGYILSILSTTFFVLVDVTFFPNPIFAQSSLSYRGYSFRKFTNPATGISTAVVSKGKKVLVRHSEGFGDYRVTEFRLIRLLGRNDKQLVITQFTGGIHCCRVYWIYDLAPNFRLLFRSRDFAIGDGGEIGEGTFQNLDADREMELVERNDSFLYFDDLAYVSLPRPLMVFDYNPRTEHFELANRKFSKFILSDLDKLIEDTVRLRNSDSAQYLVNVFSITLDYIYAGKANEGWAYYRKERDSKSMELRFHDENKIKKVLMNDKAYNLIYPK